MIRLPEAPNSIQKGVPLKSILGKKAITQLAYNLGFAYPELDQQAFIESALNGLEPLTLTERSKHITAVMRKQLPENYTEAIEVILNSLTPPLTGTENNGLASMIYMPHCQYIADYGLEHFDLSMEAQYELTKRFTCEFSIRAYLEKHQERTLLVLNKWMHDEDPHVRRLCSEGTRPRLPWAKKLSAFAKDPSPVLPILEQLKNDPELYVRRSVANHVGDIAKDHPTLALDLCEQWLEGASKELQWVIRHAVRNLVKKGNEQAIELRIKAGARIKR